VKGVAWAGSLTLLFSMPWMLRFAFRGTLLTLRSFGQTVWIPITLCLVSVCAGEVAFRLIAPHSLVLQLLLVALVFTVIYGVSIALRPVRQDLPPFRELFRELRVNIH
jgi:hypothetical protein